MMHKFLKWNNSVDQIMSQNNRKILIFFLLLNSGGWYGLQSHVDEEEEATEKSCGGKS